ncbi:ethanolamine ammonia-lyase subunit EutC [Haliea sp. E17]|uniref:ethanolamine ammonia-lyase subunit EutC n=1 Tax=Haliea sp. E17 TaxID=3401576 RepID=UPI003AAC250D
MSGVIRNRWDGLRRYTAARLAGGRAGNAQTTEAQLRFQLDHARARDAVLHPLDTGRLAQDLQDSGLPVFTVQSAADNRALYLQRPDLGRRLRDTDHEVLATHKGTAEIAVAVVDGLSSIAVERHAAALLQRLLPQLREAGYSLAPLTLANQGRVALGDDIGEALGARLVLVLIGERPGLSSPDSLGIYLTYAPCPGRLDSERNCISNIRPPEGLDYQRAADTCLYLCRNALRRQLSGVRLKDDSLELAQAGSEQIPFFR